jgi:F-type H+-transporting ATPase subunit delta
MLTTTGKALVEKLLAKYIKEYSMSALYAFMVSKQLIMMSRMIESNNTLARFLSTQTLSSKAKVDLLNEVFGKRVYNITVEKIAVELITDRWSKVDDLIDAFEKVAIEIAIQAAFLDGTLQQIENELFVYIETLKGDARLRDALSNEKAPIKARFGLIDSLLKGKANEVTLLLAKISTQSLNRFRYLLSISLIAGYVAQKRKKIIVTITSPVIPSEKQIKELEDAMIRKYNHPVQLNVVVDSDVIGGIRLQVASDVIDGTIRTQIDNVKRRFDARI